jgi:hypothetical protein
VSPEPESDRLLAQLPKLKYGFWLAGSFFICEMAWAIQRISDPSSRSAGGYAAALLLTSSIVAVAFMLSCISVYHKIVNDVRGWRHPISQRRAVRLHFIPIFNFYWNFRWPVEIAKFVNWRMGKGRMSGLLAGSTVFVGALVTAFIDGSIGLVIIFSAFAYVSRCLRDALSAPAVPQEMYAANALDAAMSFES